MKTLTRTQVVNKIYKKLFRLKLDELNKILNNLTESKEEIEYEAIPGTFNSKETGKIYTIIYRRKIKPISLMPY